MEKELPAIIKIESLMNFEPSVLSRELATVRTMSDALAVASDRTKYPSLSVMRRDCGERKVVALLSLYINDLRVNINIKRPLRDDQIEPIAREIVSEFYALTIADIHVVFRQAKTGQYGEFYDSLDMPKVMGWFRQYFADRCAAGADESVSGKFSASNDSRSAYLATIEMDKLERKFKTGRK